MVQSRVPRCHLDWSHHPMTCQHQGTTNQIWLCGHYLWIYIYFKSGYKCSHTLSISIDDDWRVIESYAHVIFNQHHQVRHSDMGKPPEEYIRSMSHVLTYTQHGHDYFSFRFNMTSTGILIVQHTTTSIAAEISHFQFWMKNAVYCLVDIALTSHRMIESQSRMIFIIHSTFSTLFQLKFEQILSHTHTLTPIQLVIFLVLGGRLCLRLLLNSKRPSSWAALNRLKDALIVGETFIITFCLSVCINLCLTDVNNEYTQTAYIQYYVPVCCYGSGAHRIYYIYIYVDTLEHTNYWNWRALFGIAS